MIAFASDTEQLALALVCRHCHTPIALLSGHCPMCGHRADKELEHCDCLACYQTRLAHAQKPRWLAPPRPLN